MKTKLLLAVLFVALTTMGFDCINQPLTVSLNIDPVGDCYTVNTGNGAFSGSTQVNLKSLIPADFQSRLQGLRIYDIRVRVVGNYPNGNVSGDGFVRFDSESELNILHFAGQYSSFAANNNASPEGISLLNSGGLITPGPQFATFLARLSAVATNLSALPTTITLRAQGSGPAVTQTFQFCVKIYFQADANAN